MAEPAVLAPVVVRRRWYAKVPLALVWLVAAVPVALWAAHRSDPELAVRCAQVAGSVLHTGGLVAGAVLLGAALFFPPFLAALRLGLHRARLAVTTDRAPLARALGELRYFETAPKHYEVGRLAFLQGDLPTAAPHLQRAVELDPSLPGPHYLFGRFLLRVGHVPAAAAEFQRAEQLDAGHAFGDALLHMGRCALLLGDAKQAVEILRQHERRHGGGRRSSYWLGEALAAAGEHEAAREAFATAAATARQKLTPDENWFRALARVRLWRRKGRA